MAKIISITEVKSSREWKELSRRAMIEFDQVTQVLSFEFRIRPENPNFKKMLRLSELDDLGPIT